MSIRQGHDPRRFTLLPLGGGGALHACALADELGIARILVPVSPGVLSAAGLLAAPVEHEVSAAFPRPLDGLDMDEARRMLDRLDARCESLMARENVQQCDVTRRYFADLCYAGQSYHLEVAFEPDALDPLAALAAAFHAAHDRTYGFAPNAPIRLINLRAVHRAAFAPDPPHDWISSGASPLRRCTSILLADRPVEAAVYDRAALCVGQMLEAPAIVEQDDTTTLLAPGWRGCVDKLGNLVLERTEQ